PAPEFSIGFSWCIRPLSSSGGRRCLRSGWILQGASDVPAARSAAIASAVSSPQYRRAAQGSDPGKVTAPLGSRHVRAPRTSRSALAPADNLQMAFEDADLVAQHQQLVLISGAVAEGCNGESMRSRRKALRTKRSMDGG